MNDAFEIVANDGDRCGEGPLWDAGRQRLIWNDMNSSLVFAYDTIQREKTVLSRGLNAAGLAFNHDGALVFSGAEGIHLWRGPGDYQTLVTQHDGQVLNFNDLTAGPDGQVYVGTFYWGEREPARPGALYRLDAQAHLKMMDEGFGVANGLGFSPDNRRLYLADSTARRIFAYQVDGASGDLHSRRVFAQLPPEAGMPDGLTVDAEGFVWVAEWYGGRVTRLDPDGAVERQLDLPAAQVTSLAFGGPDLDELYVTTSAEDWVSDFEPRGYQRGRLPLGGAVYRLRPGVRGQPEHRAGLRWRK